MIFPTRLFRPAVIFGVLCGLQLAATTIARPPNFIIIFTDDQGYNDVGCFGSPDIATPRLDRMAAEGMRFTNFYAQTVCGPSRAALMTGCYPMRVGRRDDGVAPHPKMALDEITIAEILKPAGYATGMFGKWDLAGHSQTDYTPELLPYAQGFDESWLTPSSNDQFVNLLRGPTLIEEHADLSRLTQRYTDAALAFMEHHRDEPFFIYLAHSMPHTKLAVSAEFRGKSQRGLYGDVVEELDHHIGRILDRVAELGLDETTYVFFMSDNGPWWLRGENGGSAFPLRGAKTSTWEGGLRVPCIMRAPGRIPAGTTRDLIASTLDVFPTVAKLAGVRVPQDRSIDGADLSAILHGTAQAEDRPYFYYQHQLLQAVRYGKWKLHVPSTGSMKENWARHVAPADRVELTAPTLYNLETDVGEQTDVAAAHPEVVAALMSRIAWARRDIGDHETRGVNARKVGSSNAP